MGDEYRALLKDVDDQIAWASIALEQQPDAINLWIGNSKSVTALHHDPYENIYCQIVGAKHFILTPPTDIACVGEVRLPAATYVRSESGFDVREDEPRHEVPFPASDLEASDDQSHNLPHLSQPLAVSLNAGDVLYLPALW